MHASSGAACPPPPDTPSSPSSNFSSGRRSRPSRGDRRVLPAPHPASAAAEACTRRRILPQPRRARAPGAPSGLRRGQGVLPAPHPSAAPTGACSRGPILPPPRPPILPAPPRLPLPPNLVDSPAAAAANLLPVLTPSGADSSRHPIPQPLPPPFDARIVAAPEPRRRRSTPWASRLSLATPLCSSPSRRAHPGRRCCHASSGRRTAPGGGARRPDRRAALVPKGWRCRRTTARCPGGRVGDRPLASCGPQCEHGCQPAGPMKPLDKDICPVRLAGSWC